MIKEHVQRHSFTEIVITPEHGERDTTAFSHSVKRLKDDGHYHCFVSNKIDKLQVHHIAEFSLENIVDFDKLKTFLLRFDPYGYSKLLINNPILSVDDPRNLLVLNEEYHDNINKKEGNGVGIHNVTFPAFVAQIVCKDGENPIPGENQSIEETLERVK